MPPEGRDVAAARGRLKLLAILGVLVVTAFASAVRDAAALDPDRVVAKLVISVAWTVLVWTGASWARKLLGAVFLVGGAGLVLVVVFGMQPAWLVLTAPSLAFLISGRALLWSRDLDVFLGHDQSRNDRGIRPSPARPTADDPRWGGSRGAQLVGRLCEECGARIATEAGSTDCDACHAPLHAAGCADRHHKLAHPVAPPYR